jgi:hypothetical protein
MYTILENPRKYDTCRKYQENVATSSGCFHTKICMSILQFQYTYATLENPRSALVVEKYQHLAPVFYITICMSIIQY